MRFRPSRLLLATTLLPASMILASAPAGAVFIGNSQGGTDFPAGALSFADVVVSYEPVVTNGEPTAANRNSEKTIGVPDYVSGGSCSDAQLCTFASLGDGGSITLRFSDNVLTGSDNGNADLWIFEVGPDVEETIVEVSRDGSTWHFVGAVSGSTAGVDLDGYGFGSSSRFEFVRLTDDANEGGQSGTSVGADIDAVGAISTLPATVPALSGTMLGALVALLAAFGAYVSSINRLGRPDSCTRI